MSRSTWKGTERAIARLVGGERVPVSGRGRGDQPDVRHPLLSLEIKHRDRLPGWLVDAMAQADAAAEPGQVSCVVLHQHGQRHADNVCLLRLADVVRLVDRDRGADGFEPRNPD